MNNNAYIAAKFRETKLLEKAEKKHSKALVLVRRYDYQLHRLELADKSMIAELDELTILIAALSTNIEELPEGPLKDEHRSRLAALETRQRSFQRQTREINADRKKELESCLEVQKQVLMTQEQNIEVITERLRKLEEEAGKTP